MLEVKTLGEICQLEKGSIQTGPFGSQLHQSDYTEVGIPVIMPADIIDGKVLEDRIARVDDNFADKLQRHTLEIGDIVFARRGDIGRQALITSREENWLCGTGCLKVNLGKKEIISPIFLHYYFKLPEVVDYLKNQAIGATMPNLNTEILKRIPIRYPSIENQNKIIGILSAYDELIENNKKRIALQEMMAEELYKEWFVRFRFPNYENTEFEKGVPKTWKYSELGTLGSVRTGKTPSTTNSEFYGGEFLFYKTPDMHDKYFVFETEETLTELGMQSQKSQIIQPNSIMVTCIGTGGVTAISTKLGCTNQQINSLTLEDETYLEWAYLMMKDLKPQIEAFGATGATMTNLSKTKFSNLKVLIPNNDLILEFHQKIKPVFDLIKQLTLANANLNEQKNQLLPRLISGKLSVEHLNIQQPPTPAQPTDSE